MGNSVANRRLGLFMLSDNTFTIIFTFDSLFNMDLEVWYDKIN